jgi:hypothetical protein
LLQLSGIANILSSVLTAGSEPGDPLRVVARQSTLRLVRAKAESTTTAEPRTRWVSRGGAEAALLLVSEIFLEPMVRIWFIIEGLNLDEPSSLVEMPCFTERAVRLQSQDHYSP